ncbi:MAG: hypothetical protein CML60_11740 [Rhodobacteraceae bacterium]|nr:hypothetical protein [Paracoccaceae bacterium]MBT27049.1 hypothetical protein [Paracoccaceae bacterium]
MAFALNLAYLGLPRFRYRERISKYANEALSGLGQVNGGLCRTGWYLTLQRLALVPGDKTVLHDGKVPNELWGIAYKVIFERKFDIMFSIVACLFMGALIVLGVAHEINYLDGTVAYFTSELIHWWYWVHIALGLLPPIFVWMGRSVVSGGMEYIDANIDNMKKSMQADVQKAELPPH